MTSILKYWFQVLDIVRLAEEMKLSCIQAIKMDALKSVRVESTHQVIQGEPIDESLTITRLTQAGTDDGVVTDLISDELDNVVKKCSKKHFREGEHLVNFFLLHLYLRGYKLLMTHRAFN